ncbi:MAG: Calx-beta domain-containing protein, partial [Pseudomonas sp.]|nr:Calx-beta domain-containing protein [Pseudomonas sp.]
MTFTVTRSGDTTAAATIQVATSGGTATAGVGNDYTAVSQTLSFAAGETSKTVSVAINNDTLSEGDETVGVAISNASAGTIQTGTATSTILANDNTFWYLGGNTFTAISEGAGNLIFSVVRTGDTATAASIHVATSGGTATAGSDYTALADTVLSFAPGETVKTVLVPLIDDMLSEGVESVGIAISNASVGTIMGGAIASPLLASDNTFWAVAGAGSVDEGSGSMTFTVSRTGDTAEAASIHVATSGGTATAGSDYAALADTVLSFAAGETSKTISVAINNDTLSEGNEIVGVAISNASVGTIQTGVAISTILDNDNTFWSVTSAGSVVEGAGSMSFGITRSGDSASEETIHVATSGGTATAGSDYTALPDTVLTFAAGETLKIVNVAIEEDTLSEGSETVGLVISRVSAGTTFATGPTTGTILASDNTFWSVASGNAGEGSGSMTFTVGRDGDTTSEASIQFATSGGTANPGSDYTALATVLSFAAGEVNKSITVAINNDSLSEGDETVGVVISNASLGTIILGGFAQGTIFANDYTFWAVTGAGSVDEGSGLMSFAVTRSGDTATAATIHVATSGGSAIAGSDYTALPDTVLSFAAGETLKIVNVAIAEDTLSEGSETVGLAIGNASVGLIQTGSATGTILGSDNTFWTTFGVSATEGTGSISFAVARSGDTTAEATIHVQTSVGTATAGSDYTALPDTVLTFAAGETLKTVNVAITDDTLSEGNEGFGLTLSNPSVGAIVTLTGFVTIVPNDNAFWSLNGYTVDEGAGTTGFTVTRSGDTAMAATIDFATIGGTAIAGVGNDYTSVSQTLSFAVGEISKVVTVAINDDALGEASGEAIYAVISNASVGMVPTFGLNGAATASIFDNDLSLWTIVNAGQVSEETGAGSFLVSRAGNFSSAATIDIATVGGTAMAGSDYTAMSQTLSFAAGEAFKTVQFNVLDDAVGEASKTVVAAIANASVGSIVTSTATQTINDNDLITWAIFGSAVSEAAGTSTFTVTRSGDIITAATIDVRTIGGTAMAGSDFTAVSQTLSFAAGEASKTVTVNLVDDSLTEAAETVILGLANASVGTIGTTSATGTIFDNDVTHARTYFSVGTGSTAAESGLLTWTVTRSGNVSGTQTIDVLTSDGTATAGSDYTAMTQTLTFAAGETTKVVSVAPVNDSTAEASETVSLVIRNASSGVITTGTTNATITDDDTLTYTIVPTIGWVPEQVGLLAYTITRAGITDVATTSYFRTNGGTATDGAVYTGVTSRTLSWAGGETVKIVTVQVLDDALVDGDKTLIGESASDAGFTTGSTTATVTIGDNETAAVANTYTVVVASNNVIESTSAIAYTVTRAGNLGAATTSYFGTTDGTALAGSDYTSVASQALTWSAGESSKTVLVQLLNDVSAESSETVIVTSATDAGLTTGTSTATATILDDDTVAASAYTIAVVANNVLESSGTALFSITRSGNTAVASTDYFRTNGGTATSGSDYTGVTSETLNWAAGEIRKDVLVDLTNDATNENLETIVGEIATDIGFTTGLGTATLSVYDDDSYTAAAGLADTLTTGTVNGSYGGGSILNTGDMNDSVGIGAASTNNTVIDLEAGDDTLTLGTVPNFLVNGAQYIGGTGVDTLAWGLTAALNFSTTASAGNIVKGFEILSMFAFSSVQTLGLSLANVLEFTSGNAVANTLRIIGGSTDILNLQAAGKTLVTPAAGVNVTDVDGTSYVASASAAGNASANDVSIGGATYDVYQYMTDSGLATLLLDTRVTT